MSCSGLLNQQNVFSDFSFVLFRIFLASGGDVVSQLLSRASTKQSWRDAGASRKS